MSTPGDTSKKRLFPRLVRSEAGGTSTETTPGSVEISSLALQVNEMKTAKEGTSSISPHPHPTAFLMMFVWFGLLTGFGEVFLLGIKKFYLHDFIRFGANVIWMAPLSDLCVFAVPGLILFLVARRWRTLVTLRLGVSVFGFVSFSSLLLMYSPLHGYAVLLLALGLAVQLAHLISTRPMRFCKLVQLSTLPLVMLVPLLSLGLYGWHHLREERALTGVVARPEAPNVLLIVLDTVRAQNLSLYGYSRATAPNIERLAETGVTFKTAIAPAPWTLPSHASMFTGRWPHELSANWSTPLDSTYPTLAESLAANGYNTAAFVGNTFYCGYEQGLDRGFVHYEDYVVSPAEIFMSSSLVRTVANNQTVRRALGYHEVLTQRNAEDLNDSFLSWRSRNDQRPFFAFINYFDAHELYTPPEPFDKKFGENISLNDYPITVELRRGLLEDRHKMSQQEIEAEMNAYDGAIAYIDHHLGLLFEKLEQQGVLKNTLVIITSDHGEQFGEHRLNVHGNSLYMPLLHVPLVMAYPKELPGAKFVFEPVSLRDLPATIVDIIGLNRDSFPGDSLARCWQESDKTRGPIKEALLSEVTGADFWEEWYPAVKGDLRSLVVGQFHYIKNSDGREELYDFEKDPLEMQNLAGAPGFSQVLRRLSSSLDDRVARNRLSE